MGAMGGIERRTDEVECDIGGKQGCNQRHLRYSNLPEAQLQSPVWSGMHEGHITITTTNQGEGRDAESVEKKDYCITDEDQLLAEKG